MDDFDLDRLATLRARYGKSARQRAAGVPSDAAQFKVRSSGLTATTKQARRSRTLDESADADSIRAGFAGFTRRASRS
jgi:hypothetical protein